MSQFHTLSIDEVRREANNTIYVRLNVPEPLQSLFHFTQGQYLTFEKKIDGHVLRRSYSICSAVGEPLAVAIKQIDGGAFSKYAHTHFAAGKTVQCLPPEGNFFSPLSPEQTKNYLLIAAGSGITPIISIAKTVLQQEPGSQVTLLYGNRRSADIIFRDDLSWLKNRYMQRLQWINIFSQETQDAPILNGRIDNKKGSELNRYLIDIKNYDEFFLCGPEGMISEVARGLRAIGVADEKIHYELFFASPEDAQAAIEKHQQRALKYKNLHTEVRVRAGGREVVFDLTADGENILDGAMASGLDLPFSCKGGVCATCKARIIEGQVDMDLNHALSEQELSDGFVLTCQSHPITRRVVVDFDVI
ncbi:MAG: 2Fe-2S iron-sulfur cluster-binding protein [Pseudomonadota bacterium]